MHEYCFRRSIPGIASLAWIPASAGKRCIHRMSQPVPEVAFGL